MFKLAKTYLFTALTISLITSCQMRSPRQDSWMNPGFKGRTLGKTVILATADSQPKCLQYEELFVHMLQPYVDAESLHAMHNMSGKIDKERLENLLKGTDVKTIIITSITDEANRDEMVTIGYEARPYNDGYWNNYSYGYGLWANRASVSSYLEFMLETTIYDVESQKLVWAGRKNIFDDRSSAENMQIVVKAVINEIKNKGMLK